MTNNDGYTYIRTQSGYMLRTEDGVFHGGTKENVRLKALVAANDRRVREERAEARRQMMLEGQREALADRERRYQQ